MQWTKFRKFGAAVVVLLATTSCMAGMGGALRGASVGFTPCTARGVKVDLETFDNTGGGWHWIAVCQGADYICSRTFTGAAFLGGVSSQTKCTPRPTKTATAAAVL